MKIALFAVLTLAPICAHSSALSAEPSALVPSFANVSYGPDVRNVLDLYQAEGAGPRPLVVYIHGGGWTTGDKQQDAAKFQPFLARGISYAAINYRYSEQAPLPAPVHDAARAIQFIRSRALEWNINSQRIALIGGSAGACTSMWLLLHDDLAEPNAPDPVRRQSTRVTAAAVFGGQTSIDPKVIEPWMGPNVLKHRMIHFSVGEPSIDAALANYEQRRALYVEFSPINHVDRNDPPLFMTYDRLLSLPATDASHAIHHPVYGLKLKEKSDAVGHECHLLITSIRGADQEASAVDFLVRKLLAP